MCIRDREKARVGQWKTSLDDWHNKNVENLGKLARVTQENEELKTKLAAGGGGGNGDPAGGNPPAAPVIDEKVFTEKILGEVNKVVGSASSQVLPLVTLI